MVEKNIREFLSEMKPRYNISYENFDRMHKEIFGFVVEH